jgi:hypothetical protein
VTTPTPIPLPPVSDVVLFWGDEAPDITDTIVASRLAMWTQAAADLLWLYVDLTNQPDYPRVARLVNWAIMDMAVYLYANREDVTENYSEFSGETIGSYSYSKNFRRIAGQSGTGGATGVPFFDLVVDAFTTGKLSGLVLLSDSNEFVFQPGYLAQYGDALMHDPSLEVALPYQAGFDPFGGGTA